jgi:hypothetical protein
MHRAARAFQAADARLDRWWIGPLAKLPLANRQVRAARTLLGAGRQLAAAGEQAARDVDFERVRLVDGRIDPTAFGDLAGPLHRALVVVRRVKRQLEQARVPLLLPSVERPLVRLHARVQTVENRTETAELAARVVPELLGAHGRRRYFVAIQTPAELRGSGGIIGSFATLTTTGGSLALDHVGRTLELNQGGDPSRRQLSGPPDYVARYARFSPERTWQNVTMSPDFPSVARVVQNLYPQSGGESIDGVIGVDPIALASLLDLTGPVSVPGWPDPLSSANAADVLLRQQYERFDEPARVDFLGSTAQAVFGRLITAALPARAAVVRALAPSVQGRHLMLFSDRPDEQRFLERIGAAGTMPSVRGDFFAAVLHDASGNKIDAYLQRTVRYQAAYDPKTGTVHAEASVILENRAAASGLPAIVIGGAGPIPTRPGDNRLYLSLYSPLVFDGAVVDGAPLLLESARELGRNVYSAFVTVPAKRSVTVVVRLTGTIARGNRYCLDVLRQPMVLADSLDLAFRAAGRGGVSTPPAHPARRPASCTE